MRALILIAGLMAGLPAQAQEDLPIEQSCLTDPTGRCLEWAASVYQVRITMVRCDAGSLMDEDVACDASPVLDVAAQKQPHAVAVVLAYLAGELVSATAEAMADSTYPIEPDDQGVAAFTRIFERFGMPGFNPGALPSE